MRKLNSFKAKARELARSGYFYSLPPLEFELEFRGEELERLCAESRAKHKAA